jgi:tRNA/tmRNA/rRNA uracil-C5-methylase (TrmA/RlmC/RlmD family)
VLEVEVEAEAPRAAAVAAVETPMDTAVAAVEEAPRAAAVEEEPRGCTTVVVAPPSPVAHVEVLHPPTGTTA